MPLGQRNNGRGIRALGMKSSMVHSVMGKRTAPAIGSNIIGNTQLSYEIHHTPASNSQIWTPLGVKSKVHKMGSSLEKRRHH